MHDELGKNTSAYWRILKTIGWEKNEVGINVVSISCLPGIGKKGKAGRKNASCSNTAQHHFCSFQILK